MLASGALLEGKYLIHRLLGAGGMGSVWLAEHTMLGRQVAVKVLDRGVSNREPSAIQRFLREAQTAAQLRSEHIVDVLDVGRLEDGTPFLVMELLEGESLSARIQRLGKLSAADATNLLGQLLEGLAAAHGAGVIHRDIKPDNCFLVLRGVRDHLKLLDFGISKVAPKAGELEKMTKTGVVMGTPYYMAPEQARGSKDVDHRCDLYACGAILYESLTGKTPFDGENVNELLFKIALEPLTPPTALVPDLDPALEQVVLTAMARDPAQRFQTAESFREALSPFAGPNSIPPSFPKPQTTSSQVVRSSHAGATQVMGHEATQPAPALSTPTPSGIPALSRTGALSSPPLKRRSPYIIAVVALAALGGFALFSTRRSGDRATASTSAETSRVGSTANSVVLNDETKSATPVVSKLPPAVTVAEPTPAADQDQPKSSTPPAKAGPSVAKIPTVFAPPTPAVTTKVSEKPFVEKPVIEKPAPDPAKKPDDKGPRGIDSTL